MHIDPRGRFMTGTWRENTRRCFLGTSETAVGQCSIATSAQLWFCGGDNSSESLITQHSCGVLQAGDI